MPGEQPAGGHTHLHGRPVSWVLVGTVTAAFIVGAFAIVSALWWLFWVCLAVSFIAVPVGKVIDIMGDTVLAGDITRQTGQLGAAAEDMGSAADPGVDVGWPRAVDA